MVDNVDNLFEGAVTNEVGQNCDKRFTTKKF